MYGAAAVDFLIPAVLMGKGDEIGPRARACVGESAWAWGACVCVESGRLGGGDGGAGEGEVLRGTRARAGHSLGQLCLDVSDVANDASGDTRADSAQSVAGALLARTQKSLQARARARAACA